jgi:hypothetical protein
MTREVIDSTRRRWFACIMNATEPFDRTLRAVLWMDAFLSEALVVVGVVTSPLIATVGVPTSLRFVVAVGAIVCGVLLAAFGAITAVLIAIRMRAGHYLLPPRLRLPLPPPMRPTRDYPRPPMARSVNAVTAP